MFATGEIDRKGELTADGDEAAGDVRPRDGA